METSSQQYTTTGLTDGSYFRSHYTNIRILKRAIYGAVHLAFHHGSQQEVAIKIIHPQSVLLVRQERAQGGLPREDWVKELEAMRILQGVGGHPSVVRLLEDFEENGCVFIVMEFCKGGEMFDTMEHHGAWNHAVAKQIFRQFMEGVLFIHSMDISHRDLSLENTLFHDGGPKICDFGGCIQYEGNSIDGGLIVRDRAGRDSYVHRVGKQFYMSPQILAMDHYDGLCTDIWSAGAFLFLLLTAHPPWEYAHPVADTSNAYRAYVEGGPEAFKKFVADWKFLHFFGMGDGGGSSECWNLLMLLLHPNENERCTAIEALDHAWLRDEEGRSSGNGGSSGSSGGSNGNTDGAKDAAGNTEVAASTWTCTTWNDMTCNQQSRLRLLQKMLQRHGSEYPPLVRALHSTVERSGWTFEQLLNVLHQMNGTSNEESNDPQRCTVT